MVYDNDLQRTVVGTTQLEPGDRIVGDGYVTEVVVAVAEDTTGSADPLPPMVLIGQLWRGETWWKPSWWYAASHSQWQVMRRAKVEVV